MVLKRHAPSITRGSKGLEERDLRGQFYSLQFTKGPQWGDAQRRPGSTRTAKGKAHPSTLTRHATYEGESELGNTDKGRTHARVMTHEC